MRGGTRAVSAWVLLAVVACLLGCGIKGPPRPPLDEPGFGAPQPVSAAPDAGCCRERPSP